MGWKFIKWKMMFYQIKSFMLVLYNDIVWEVGLSEVKFIDFIK